MMLRIAMISYHTCPLAVLGGKHTGGMNVYVRELARALGARGVHVDVFTRSEDPAVPAILHTLGYGQRVIHVPAGPQHPLPKALWPRYVEEFTQGVLELVRERRWRYHIVHSHYWLSGLVARRLREAWRVPWVHMFHTLQARKPAAYREAASPQREEAEAALAREADRVICATPSEQRFLYWHYRVPLQRLEVLPPGVDTTRFYPIPRREARAFAGLDPTRKVLLYVGRLDPIKGLDVLLEAMARLKARRVLRTEEALLVLIGGQGEDEAPPERLRALRDAHGLQDLVLFIGPRDQEVLPYYYAAADVVVLPSHYESFGLSLLEAMACGRPVVASRVDGPTALVHHGVSGFLFPPNDPEALAGYLAVLLQDARLRRRMGWCAFRHAQRYAWPRIARRMHRLYRLLVG